jgi:glycosyltransferase involved in cell wall biosynthesis
VKILHIVWNLIRGGTEGQCARVVLELRRQGLDQRVAVFRREGFFLEPVEGACGRVYEIGIRRMLSPRTLREVFALAGFVRSERFDLVHTWDADAAVFGQFAAALAGVPLITSRRDLGQIYPRHKLWLMNRADRRARAVVVNAEAIRDRIVAGGIAAGKVHRVSNILDLEEWAALARQPLPIRLPEGRLVGMVARLDPEKDVATFIRAAGLVARDLPDVSFVVAGDGPDRGAAEALASELGIRDRVIFLGDVTYVPALLTRLSIGVLVPRSNEGLSNTILEYMAAGLPVVATDCGGNRELVRDGDSGFVAAPVDATKVADRLRHLLDHNALRRHMGQQGLGLVERDHRPQVVARRFHVLYRHTAALGR